MSIQITICRNYVVEAVCLEFLSIEALRKSRPWFYECWKCGLPSSQWVGDYVGLAVVENGQQDRIVCSSCALDLVKKGVRSIPKPKGGVG